jgi:hypothetical protein
MGRTHAVSNKDDNVFIAGLLPDSWEWNSKKNTEKTKGNKNGCAGFLRHVHHRVLLKSLWLYSPRLAAIPSSSTGQAYRVRHDE